jgi:hypothetical protein
MTIPFTQYLRLNGRKRPVEIDRPEEIEAIARRFIESGGRYECEELTTRPAFRRRDHMKAPKAPKARSGRKPTPTTGPGTKICPRISPPAN